MQKLKQLLVSLKSRLLRFLLYNSVRFFRIRDSSERIARGFALGLAVNFYPTFGFGVFISGFMARLFGGNLLAGFLGGATLTFFFPFLFYLNMITGGWVQGRFLIKYPSEVTEAKMDALVWGATFTIGAIINSLLLCLIVYLLLLALLYYFRSHGLALLQKLLKRQRKPVLPFKSASLY